MPEVIPAIIPKTFREVEEKTALVKGLVDTVQVDFCEGGFIPSQPLPFTDALDYEAHLMVPDPRPLIDDLVRVGFSRILMQVEALSAESFADAIHEWRGSVEIGPSLEIDTPLEAIDSFAHEISCLQLMGIAHIGTQGQPFDERVVARVSEAHARFPRLSLAVDGGVSLANARALLDAGASRLVVGSAIFGSPNEREAIGHLKNLLSFNTMKAGTNASEGETRLPDTHLTDAEIRMFARKANEIRITLIEALIEAGSGHTAGPLGMADIFTFLYFHELRHDPKRPDWPERDWLVLSNGHICPVLYSAMCHAGYADVDEYKKTLRKFGTKFQGHPHREYFPALETSSGPLGSGLSQATGMALAERIDSGRSYKRWIYCLMSDGELDAGNSWEGAMLAGKEKLGNLIAIIDRNNIQIDGFTEDIMPLEPLADKWKAWNWHTQEIDGHSFVEIHGAIQRAKAVFDQPSVIIARTIPGKGVPDFERDYHWHGKPPTPKEGEMALAVLRELGEKLRE